MNRRKHRKYQEGDEFVCKCGFRWGVKEPDPHREMVNRIVFENGQYVLKTIKPQKEADGMSPERSQVFGNTLWW